MSIPPSVLRAHSVKTLEDRVEILRGLVREGDRAFNKKGSIAGSLLDPRMRQIGLWITQHCPPRNDECELRAIFDFVTKPVGPHKRPNVRYTGDIAGKDTFQAAIRTLQMGGGDCDDHSVLCSVLASENGFFTKFRITSNTGATWDHIYCMAGVPKHNPKRWVALDTTLGPGKFGVQPPRKKHRDFLVTRVS